MGKPSTAFGFPILKFRDVHRFGTSGTTQAPEWADAETRAFLERPERLSPFAQVLRVILITAMVIALVKIAWIIAFHA